MELLPELKKQIDRADRIYNLLVKANIISHQTIKKIEAQNLKKDDNKCLGNANKK